MAYWEERQKQLDKQLEKDEEKLKKKLSKIYEKEAAKLEKKIAAFYQQYGEENILEYRNLLIQLEQEDITLLMEQMDEFAKKYPQYADLLPVRENIYKLNRLEGLQTSIRMQQLEIGVINNQELHDHLEKNAQRYVNQTAEVLGFGKNFYSINSDIVQSFVNAAWSNGTNYSTKIWQNTEKLANYLNTDVSQAFARGDSYQRIIRNMKDRFEKVSRNDMYRLIYTEGTYVKNEASVRPFEDDFDTYKISYVKDGKACQICRKIAQKTFEIKDRQPGVNFPPFHPWCRCSFTVEVEDWDAWIDDYVEKHGSDITDAKKIVYELGGKDFTNSLYYENQKTKKKAIDYLKNTLGMKESNMNSIPLEIINDVNTALANIYNDYQDLKGVVQKIAVEKPKGGGLAEFGVNYNRGEIKTTLRLDPSYFKDYEALQKLIRRNVESGYYSKKSGIEGVIRHEFAHALDVQGVFKMHNVDMFNTNVNYAIDRWQTINKYSEGELANEVVKLSMYNLGLKPNVEYLEKYVSRYAADSFAKTGKLTEAFAEILSDENKGDLYNEIINVLIEKGVI